MSVGRAERLRKEDFTSPQSCARTSLPVSPDKAAVLLLLARNECVGVSSLFTTLLSQGLSCRRRAKCHHISKMLGTLFPGPRGCSTSCLIPPQSGSLRQPRGVLQGGHVAMSQGNRIPTRGEPLFHEHCLSSTLTAGSNGAAGMDFAHHLC